MVRASPAERVPLRAEWFGVRQARWGAVAQRFGGTNQSCNRDRQPSARTASRAFLPARLSTIPLIGHIGRKLLK